MRNVLRGHVESGEVPALVSLISRRGDTHAEVFGEAQRDSIFRIASLTKPITAAAAMILVEECRLRLDEPVDSLLPELADRRVLKSVEGAVDDTVAANRSITTRDLLTLRMGMGHIMRPGDFPIMKAAQELGFLIGPPRPQSQPGTDEWIRRLGTLPLMYQPGETWAYDIGLDVLGVLVARASGQTFGAFLKERIFEPLGMKDTGFYVPSEKLGRFTTSYRPDGGGLAVYDPLEGSEWGRPVPFESGSGGLVSTADDYMAFCQMLLNKGRFGGEQILSRASVELMTTDQLTAKQSSEQPIFFGDDRSWGFGMGVVTRRMDYPSVGSFGWTGGLGTLAITDPAEELVAILMTQRMMDSPVAPKAFTDFTVGTYQAINDGI